jgi:hypothetical protein
MRTICYANRHFATIQLSMKTRFMLFQKTIVRYLFGIAAVVITFGLRIWLIPLTGTSARFVFAPAETSTVFDLIHDCC